MTVDLASRGGATEGVATQVRAAEPDVVAVFGAPRRLRWRSKRAAFARECGLVVATADRPGGVLLMVALRAAVIDTTFTRLPSSSAGPANVVTAVLETLGARWRIAAAALDGLGPDVVGAALPAADSTPLIVAGNLGEPVAAGLADRLPRHAAGPDGAILAESAVTVLGSSNDPMLSVTFVQ
jgi:hypothetical protein